MSLPTSFPTSFPTRRLLAALTSLALLLTGAGGAAAAISGPDVSSYQHSGNVSIGWSSAAASGRATFGFVKATEGTGYRNPWFSSDFAGLASSGIMRGAYHFANPAQSATAQASYFVSVVGTLGRVGDLPPVLDLETSGGLSPSALVAWTQTWLQTVKSLTGRTPMIYTGPYFWQSAMGNSRAFTGYPLWIASYGVSSPAVPGGWPTWTFWQYTSSASLPGVSGAVDMNVFNGSLAQLQALANGAPVVSPAFGRLDTTSWSPGAGLVATGWAIDPSTPGSSSVSLRVDGGPSHTVLASSSRPDVAAAYPGYGSAHGYSATFVVPPGAHSVCAVALGRVPAPLGCQTVTVPVTPPLGSLDSVAWNGTALTLGGWAIDPATTAPTTVTVQVDGTTVTSLTADGTRTDVGAAYPLYGAAHGYATTMPMTPGAHQVCVTAAGTGTNRQFTCRSVTVPLVPPLGRLDAMDWTGRTLSVSGWAIDPRTASPIPVTLTVDGVPAGPSTTASGSRPDVAAAYPAFGPLHGFATSVTPQPGAHRVCATAAGATGAAPVTLECEWFSVPGWHRG